MKLVVTLMLIVSCSPKVRHNLLSTFFDGVPEYVDTTSEDSVLIRLDSDSISSSLEESTATVTNSSIHLPYSERECSSCHDHNKVGGMVNTQPTLCFQCHDNMAFTQDFTHGPIAGGYCTSCHNPHMAESPNLLHESGQAICLNCHNSNSVMANVVHGNIGESNCTNCHDPHSSNSRFNLQSGLCFKCHEDFGDSYTFLHGPVQGEYCNKCHESHLSDRASLVSRTGQELCLHCHESVVLQRTAAHNDIGFSNCTNCHNPHGGEDRFMLN